MIHTGGEETFGVHLDSYAFDTHGGRCFEGRHEGIFFRHDVRAAGGEHS